MLQRPRFERFEHPFLLGAEGHGAWATGVKTIGEKSEDSLRPCRAYGPEGGQERQMTEDRRQNAYKFENLSTCPVESSLWLIRMAEFRREDMKQFRNPNGQILQRTKALNSLQ